MRPKGAATSRLDEEESSMAPKSNKECGGIGLGGEIIRVRQVGHTRQNYRILGVVIRAWVHPAGVVLNILSGGDEKRVIWFL